MTAAIFSKLSDDVVLNIFSKLEDDPRNWARLACVCSKFTSLIRHVCWKSKCNETIPSVVTDLLPSPDSSFPGGWSALYKLAVCCPGLQHAGVLLELSDFGLERELGPDDYFRISKATPSEPHLPQQASDSCSNLENCDSSWSCLMIYITTPSTTCEANEDVIGDNDDVSVDAVGKAGYDFPVSKRRKVCCRSFRSHLASGVWSLNREEGNKLLARRFRGDCLYICDWPGCVHTEEKRNYMLFRGIFKNFKKSRVWRTMLDGNRSKTDLNCAFCECKETWDLNSAFCLKRGCGYHDDGEPVVRAYVCENGHVSGAWTDWPLYT
ncbi:phytochrome A-associated F-box protein [Salix suchowensis]|nr:phytochrome A-associated F-box protein [Salix suchowensis]